MSYRMQRCAIVAALCVLALGGERNRLRETAAAWAAPAKSRQGRRTTVARAGDDSGSRTTGGAMKRTFRNPIIPGFYPDPSICRVGDDYYLITSTFEYFPGLPVFHSRDLVNWRQIGHVLNRPSQLDLDGIVPSGGLYAPTIRHHDGTFYVINTIVRSETDRANFIVTSKDPSGPWSEPHWLKDAPGIDPSLYFDDDGRVWYTGNRPKPGGMYKGHKDIWLQEIDMGKLGLIGEKYSLWDGALKGARYAEAPHIYKVDGTYYLLIAEGGTFHDHAVTVARSKTITGPYESNPRNPILTHRHLGKDYPIVGTGHGDLVRIPDGSWWMVLLGTRPYGGYNYNLGRETFLTPVSWEDGWPVVSPGTGRVEATYPVPSLPYHPWPETGVRDEFDREELGLHWNFLRTPREEFFSLSTRRGYLRLRLRPQMLAERVNPSFIGRRLQHRNFTASTCVEFVARSAKESAGMVLLQNNYCHFRFVVTLGAGGKRIVRLIARRHGRDKTVSERPVDNGSVYLRVIARGQEYDFFAANKPGAWETVAEAQDGRILSSTVAGGFVGAYVGMYAGSNGTPSDNHAEFDWFEYSGAETN